jgi:sortase A
MSPVLPLDIMISSSLARRSFDLRLLERVLFVLAIVLLSWYGLQRSITFFDQRASNRELEEIRMAVAPDAGPSTAPRPRPAPGSLVGRIELPRVGLAAIVREGDDTAVLRRAVGHIPETALPGEIGNAGLAGHRDTFFSGLRNVRRGDRIIVTTPGSIAHYEVRSTRIVEPTDVSVLAPTPTSTLTLVTCYPFNYLGAAPQRFIVHAELTGIDDNSDRDPRRIQAQHD